jgi:hypothetical protein
MPYEKSRDKSCKAKICISLRHEREKVLSPRIQPNRKGGITQDPQDKLNRIRDQKITNDRSIHKNRPEHDRAGLHDPNTHTIAGHKQPSVTASRNVRGNSRFASACTRDHLATPQNLSSPRPGLRIPPRRLGFSKT